MNLHDTLLPESQHYAKHTVKARTHYRQVRPRVTHLAVSKISDLNVPNIFARIYILRWSSFSSLLCSESWAKYNVLHRLLVNKLHQTIILIKTLNYKTTFWSQRRDIAGSAKLSTKTCHASRPKHGGLQLAIINYFDLLKHYYIEEPQYDKLFLLSLQIM